MNILCNGEPVTLDEASSVSLLMKERGFLLKKGIAVAVNNTVILRNEWENFMLQNNDNVLIITAVQGG